MSEENANAPTEDAPATAGDLAPSEESATPQRAEPASWTESLSEDERAYLATKGWDKEGRGVKDILSSYRNLERLRGVGADRLVKLPEEGNVEQAKEFYSRLGVPETPDGYETPEVPLGANDVVDATALSAISHRINHTPAQHAEFANAVSEYLTEAQTKAAEEITARDTLQQRELDADWATKKDENYAAAKRAAERFGIGRDDLNAMQQGLGYRKTVELLHRIGRAIGEGAAPGAVRDGGKNGAVSRSDASAQLEALKNDAGFRQRLTSGDAEARKHWETLKQLAFYGD